MISLPDRESDYRAIMAKEESEVRKACERAAKPIVEKYAAELAELRAVIDEERENETPRTSEELINERSRVESDKSTAIAAAREAFITPIVARYDLLLNRLNRDIGDAIDRERAVKAKANETGSFAPFLNKVLVQQDPPRPKYGDPKPIRFVLQVLKYGDPVPRAYVARRAVPGDIVLRNVKKNGEVGARMWGVQHAVEREDLTVEDGVVVAKDLWWLFRSLGEFGGGGRFAIEEQS